MRVIEVELKAKVRDAGALRAVLRRRAAEEVGIYRDTYYDKPGGELNSEGRELRVRVAETADARRAVLTYKEPPVGLASCSKPEHETEITGPVVVDVVLRALGMDCLVAFEKHCANYRFTASGRDMLATLVTVPEVDGTFVELETMAEESDIEAALGNVRTVLYELGITEGDLTTEQYTDAVLRSRS